MKHVSLCLLIAAGCGNVVDAPKGMGIDASVDAASSDAAPAELCNGIDDDGDGAIDKGCPADGPLAFQPGTSSAVIGGETTHGQAGTPLERRFPLGSVVIGLHGHAAESIDSLGVLCGVPRVVHADEAPFSYTVEISDGDTLAPVGGPGGSPFESRCPANTAVVAATLMTATTANGASIYGVTLECSGLGLERTDTVTLTRVADPVALDRIGTGNASLPPEPTSFGCPAGELLGDVTGAYGPWPLYNVYIVVNALQLHCVKANVPVL